MPATGARAVPHNISARATWPLPDTPGDRPCISPARRVSEAPASRSRDAAASSHARAASHTRSSATGTPGERERLIAGAGRSRGRPSHCASMPLGGRAPGVRPVGHHLAATQHRDAVRDTRSTSASLWLMKMIDRPCRHHAAPSTANSASLSWGVNTAVGSSRIRIRAPRVQRLQDLDPLAFTHRQARRRGRPGRPDRLKLLRGHRVELLARASPAPRDRPATAARSPS